MAKIRSFRNADLPVLLKIWEQHYSGFGPTPRVTAPMFEQAVLSRTFFDPSGLLVWQDEQGVQAWCHTIRHPANDDVGRVAALCALPASDAGSMTALLEESERRWRELGARQLTVGVVRDDCLGYAGLEPVGHGIGVFAHDTRVEAALRQRGYSQGTLVDRLVASTHGFRPPVNREALQLRRSTRLESSELVFDDPRQASAMAHFDVHLQKLVDATGREIAALHVWLSDPEAEVMNPGHAILELEAAHDRGSLKGTESYLVGQVVQLLAERRVETVETAVDASQRELVDQLQAIRFQVTDCGNSWSKILG